MTTFSSPPPLPPPPALSHQDLVYGGLEVTLRNHHTLIHDAMIGGVRLCVPLKKPSPDGSPRGSRSYSPDGPAENGTCKKYVEKSNPSESKRKEKLTGTCFNCIAHLSRELWLFKVSYPLYI